MRILGVVPARLGSKGVPRKNIVPVAGKPLIAYMLEAARRARHLSRLIVSTESEEIAHVARDLGVEVPFLRPPELSDDEVSIIPVNRHAMAFFDQEGWRADVVVSLQVTSPLTAPADIDAAIEKLFETGCDSVVSVKPIQECHPYRAYKLSDDRVLPFYEYTSEESLQRQDRPPAYKFNGAIYVRRRDLLEQWNGKDFGLGKDVRGVLMPPDRSVDVNEPLDLLLVEALLRARGSRESQGTDENEDRRV